MQERLEDIIDDAGDVADEVQDIREECEQQMKEFDFVMENIRN